MEPLFVIIPSSSVVSESCFSSSFRTDVSRRVAFLIRSRNGDSRNSSARNSTMLSLVSSVSVVRRIQSSLIIVMSGSSGMSGLW